MLSPKQNLGFVVSGSGLRQPDGRPKFRNTYVIQITAESIGIVPEAVKRCRGPLGGGGGGNIASLYGPLIIILLLRVGKDGLTVGKKLTEMLTITINTTKKGMATNLVKLTKNLMIRVA